MNRSADGIHFLDKSYKLYRDRSLELRGIRYEDIEVQIDQSYNPLRLPRIEANQSGGGRPVLMANGMSSTIGISSFP